MTLAPFLAEFLCCFELKGFVFVQAVSYEKGTERDGENGRDSDSCGKCFIKKRKTAKHKNSSKNTRRSQSGKAGMRSGHAQTGYRTSRQTTENQINKPESKPETIIRIMCVIHN